MSSKPVDRPPALRAATAPEYDSPKYSPSEIQWLLDGSRSRPPTPHSLKRTRLLRGPSPMKSPNLPAPDDQAALPQSQSANFPLLPSLNQGGNSKLGRKFSRRLTGDNLKLSSKSSDSVEFDKLETLTTVSFNQTCSNREYDLANQDPERDNWLSCSSGRRSTVECVKSTDPTSLESNQGKSTFLDFFRRGTTSSSSGSSQKGFDDLSLSKPARTNAIKKQSDRTVLPMQPRSPRYGGGRDRHSLPEIERLIRLSQKRRETAVGSNSSASHHIASSSSRSITNRVRSLKLDK